MCESQLPEKSYLHVIQVELIAISLMLKEKTNRERIGRVLSFVDNPNDSELEALDPNFKNIQYIHMCGRGA